MQGWFLFLYNSSLNKILLLFKLHWVAFKMNTSVLKLSIYKRNLLTTLLEFISIVHSILPLALPTTSIYFFKIFNYNVGSVQNMLFYNLNQVSLIHHHIADNMGVCTGGRVGLVSCDLMRRLQHLHQEGVDRRVPDQLEEEQMLQALEANGAQGRKTKKKFGKPADSKDKCGD